MNAVSIIEQLNVTEDRRSGFLSGSEIEMMRKLVLQVGEETLGHRIVVGGALITHAGKHANTLHVAAVSTTSIETTLIRVMNAPGRWQAMGDRHLEGGQRQCLVVPVAHRPAHHLARIQIKQHRQKEPSRPSTDKGDIADPSPIGQSSMEIPFKAIRRYLRHLVMFDLDPKPLFAPGFNTRSTAQACDTMLATGHALLVQCFPCLERTVSLAAIDMDLANPGQQGLIGKGACRGAAFPPFVNIRFFIRSKLETCQLLP